MVVCAPNNVARIAADIDVLGTRVDAERVDRQVGLDEPSMALRFKCGHHRLVGIDPKIHPGCRAFDGIKTTRCAQNQPARRFVESRRWPDLPQVTMMMSSSRNLEPFQRVESKIAV
jgi:hypothetical protein